MRAQRNHGLDGKAHSGLCRSDGLILGVVGDVRRAMEELVDAVAAVRLDHTAVPLLRQLLNNVAWIAEQHPRLHDLDRLIQRVACRLDDANRVRICKRLVTNVVCLVNIAVESFMVERNVDVKDVAILQNALVGNTVANDFVQGGADRLREVAVVKRRWVRLSTMSDDFF